ncbi:glycogenin-1-like [Oculina patagonica]
MQKYVEETEGYEQSREQSRIKNEYTRTRQKGSRRTICAVAFIPSLIVVIFLVVWRPLLLPYFFRYAKMVISEFMNDKQRFKDNQLQMAQKEWRMYQIESRFGQDWCKENVKSRSDVTWLTVIVNDDFAPPTLVLGHSIRTFSCQKNMIAFVSEKVSEGTRKALQSVGWNTRLVEEIDCSWMDAKVGGDRNSGWFSKPLGHGIRGTHTRFHAWNYTQFSKIIYLDADYMLMTNIDDLFDIPDEFAAVPCSRPGVLDPCFNAGLLVFRPDASSYQEIMKNWFETTEKDTCPNDQVLLWHFYADAGNWKALPYAYNIRRIIYRPLNSFHYACCKPPKPWSAECRPSRKEASDFSGPILTVEHMALIFWKNFYELLKKYQLEEWWRSTKFFRPSQEFGVVSYADCWNQINN